MDNQFNDDELQKAIDDITKDAASGGSSSVVDDLVKKNEEKEPTGKVVSASTDLDNAQPAFAPAPEVPVPPVTDMNAPAVDTPEENKPEEAIPGPEVPLPEPAVEEPVKAEETSAAAEVAGPAAPVEAPTPEAAATPAVEEPAPAPAIVKKEAPVAPAPVETSAVPGGDFEKTREEALKALYPLMDKVKIDDPVQKFDMYKEMFGLMKNAEVAGSVLKAAEELPDEQTKADALMGLIKSIDELK